jgi:hypothetical protein
MNGMVGGPWVAMCMVKLVFLSDSVAWVRAEQQLGPGDEASETGDTAVTPTHDPIEILLAITIEKLSWCKDLPTVVDFHVESLPLRIANMARQHQVQSNPSHQNTRWKTKIFAHQETWQRSTMW